MNASEVAEFVEGLDRIDPLPPEVVTLCGSTRFKEAFEKANRDLTLQGKIVISVGLFGHLEGLDMDGPTKKMLDQLHLRKIDKADTVMFLNVNGYLGESSRRELEYARKHNKRIEFLEPDKAPPQPLDIAATYQKWREDEGRSCYPEE